MKSKNTSRRAFLSAGLMLPVVGASSRMGLADTGMGLFRSPEESTGKASTPAKLEYRTLGRTGLKVTTLGFGCMITSDPSVVQRAVDIGINYFDSSRGYQHGNNERMVGAALGSKRKQVVLSTKTDTSTRDSMQKELETSLRELKTDFIDIWYLHGKDNVADVTDEMIEAQQIAKKQGKIRFAGVSTHKPQILLPWMAQKGVFDVALTVYNFSMDSGVDQAIATATKAGIGVVAMKVMAGGFKDIKPSDPLYAKLKTDGAMLAAHLDAIKPIYCRMCGQCDGMCQKDLPVADMLRILTYADGYRQFALGRERFQELAAEHRAVRCCDCAECTVECPHGVRVSDRMARAQELFA